MRSVLPGMASVALRLVRVEMFSGPSDFAAFANSRVIAWISDALSGLDFLHPTANEMNAKIAARDSAKPRRFRRTNISRLTKDAITRDILAKGGEKLK